MNYKIIFSDIDGTLLNKDRKLSELTKKVIRELNSQIPVVLISSRMPQAMRHLQDDLHISHQPIICYNGGLILVNDKPVSTTAIPIEILQELKEFNSSVKCHLSLYHGEEWYVPEMDKWALREANNTQVTPTVLSNEEVIKKWKTENKGAHKVMCMGEEEQIDKIVEYLSANFQNGLHLYRSKPTYLEVASSKVSKLTAINTLLEKHFHLDIKDVIAFGDNYNDYEMLKAAGLGIAVGNAKPEILEIANEITHHGKEDGVAKSLQKLFKLS